MKILTCCKCRIEYAVPEAFEATKRQDESTFYCPHGHPQRFPRGETAEEKMRRERDRAVQEQARLMEVANAAERERAAAVRKLKRTTRRAHAGVCLHCNRSFVALARHMKTKHPQLVCVAGGKA